MWNWEDELTCERAEVKTEWLSQALNFKIKPHTLKWKSEGGDENKISLQFENVGGECWNLVATFLGSSCDEEELNKKVDNERNFYSTLLSDMDQVIGYTSPFLYATSTLVLQTDLHAQGYHAKPFHEKIPYHHFDKGIIFLAKLHFATTAVECRKKFKLPEVYPWLSKRYDPLNPSIHQSFHLGLQNLETFLPETHRHAFVDLKGNADLILEKVLAAGEEFPTGIHGALWQNNILFLSSGKPGEPEEEDHEVNLKVVDWKMMGYADPLFDLAIYILSCFPEDDLSIMSVELTVLRYTEEFSKLLAAAVDKTDESEKCEGVGLKRRTDFHENLQFFNTYGLAYAFIWFTMSSKEILNTAQNEARLVKVFKFLHDDMDLPAFLYSIL